MRIQQSTSHRPALAALVAVAAALASATCDRAPDAPQSTTRPATRRADVPRPTRVALELVGTVPVGRPSQLAATADGAVFALVADAPGDAATVRRVDDAAAPRLAPDDVVRALGLAGRGSGQIVAIAARDDGAIAFAFAGDAALDATAARTAIAALGIWSPASGEARITVDQTDLARVDPTLADDVAVAAPTLIVAGDDAWLWRAHGDGGGEIRLVTVRGLGAMRPELSAGAIRVGGEQAAERRAWEWSADDPAGAGTFLLTDTASRWIRRLDARVGRTEHVARFDADAGIDAIAPATVDAAGRPMTLALDRDGVARSLVVQDAGSFAAIDAGNFTLGGARGAAGPLHVGRLVPIAGRPGQFLAHDVATGRVFRATVE